MEWDKLWATNKKNIDPVSGRYTAISQDRICIMNVQNVEPESTMTTIPLYDKNPSLGTKIQFKSNQLYLEFEDVTTLKEGEKVNIIK